MLTPSGAMVQSIIVENDGLFEEDPSLGQNKDWEKLSRDIEILNKIEAQV